MSPFELTNEQRTYFGVVSVPKNWNKQILSENVSVYFDNNIIRKVIRYDYGYLEYDVDIRTKGRDVLLPQTARGKEQKLTVPRLLKVKGTGVQFSASFEGGGITVYNNKRNIFFIKSYLEEGSILNYTDIDNWIKKYIKESAKEYRDWLNEELSKKRENNRARVGDIIAYRVSRSEWAFARVVVDKMASNNPLVSRQFFDTNLLFRNGLIITLYTVISATLDVNLDNLLRSPKLSTIYIGGSGVTNGEFPIVTNKPLEGKDFQVKVEENVYLTIPYSKTDILKAQMA